MSRLRYFAILAFMASALSACSFVDVRDQVTYEHDGKRVPEEIIQQITAGKTTRKWVMEYLGKPDAMKSHKNGSEVFTYRFSENKNQRVRVLFLFKYEDTGHKEKHVFIQFVNGRVHKLWRDYTLPMIPENMYDYQIIDTVEKEPPLWETLTKQEPVQAETAPQKRTPQPSVNDSGLQRSNSDDWWWPL
ncbi:MAG: hypothetical protein AseanaTS_21440 [Candidatus Pelagadaptatus aseana]|uniref:hypothetical protein n=1 Tax=Candidatus Pelagadaptatus aseana TaxID=3120508 RepID=UPI0039B1E21C